ncbi:hypothetical protein ACEE04_09665 [Streptococcus porcinus]
MNEKFNSAKTNQKLEKLLSAILRVDTLIRYQKDELEYHKDQEDWVKLKALSNRAHTDRLFITHLSNIVYLPKNTKFHFTTAEQTAILNIAESISEIIETGGFERGDEDAEILNRSVIRLDEFEKQQVKSHIIYEILMTYRILDECYA